MLFVSSLFPGLQEVLHAYPQIIVDPLDTGVVRVRLSGDAYNRKTLNRVKKTLPKPQVCLLFDFCFPPNSFSPLPCLYQSCSLFVSSNRLRPATVGGFSASMQVFVFSVSLKLRLKKCLVTVKSLAQLLQIGQLGAVRQR